MKFAQKKKKTKPDINAAYSTYWDCTVKERVMKNESTYSNKITLWTNLSQI